MRAQKKIIKVTTGASKPAELKQSLPSTITAPIASAYPEAEENVSSNFLQDWPSGNSDALQEEYNLSAYFLQKRILPSELIQFDASGEQAIPQAKSINWSLQPSFTLQPWVSIVFEGLSQQDLSLYQEHTLLSR